MGPKRNCTVQSRNKPIFRNHNQTPEQSGAAYLITFLLWSTTRIHLLLWLRCWSMTWEDPSWNPCSAMEIPWVTLAQILFLISRCLEVKNKEWCRSPWSCGRKLYVKLPDYLWRGRIWSLSCHYQAKGTKMMSKECDSDRISILVWSLQTTPLLLQAGASGSVECPRKLLKKTVHFPTSIFPPVPKPPLWLLLA